MVHTQGHPQASVEARLREVAEPLKRRVRGHGHDPLGTAREARDREPPFRAPVDAVIAWVDDEDPEWRAARDAVVRSWGDGPCVRDSTTVARFRSLGELRYVLRGIERYLPWVRQVLLVTSGQRPPAWLDTSLVRVVTHAEFMHPDAVPTLNSHAIEAAMWRIEGLSEHFVYFNDDVLVARPIRSNDMFTPEGLPRVCLTDIPVPPGPPRPGDSAAYVGSRNARSLLAQAGVGDAARLVAHVPGPQLRSIHAELAERFPAELAATERARVRALTDVAPVFLHTWYALLSGRAERVRMTHRYVELSTADGVRHLDVEVRRHDVDYLCPNLAADPVLPWSDITKRVDEALSVLLPGRSRFER